MDLERGRTTPPVRQSSALDQLPDEVLLAILSHVRRIDIFALKLAGSRRVYHSIGTNLYTLSFDEYVQAIEDEGKPWMSFTDHFVLSLAAARGQTSLMKALYDRAAESAERHSRAFSADSTTWDIGSSHAEHREHEGRTIPIDTRGALEWAASFGRDDIVELLLNTPPPEQAKGMVSRTGRRKYVLPPNNPPLPQPHASSGTAMHFAAAGGHETTVRLLLSRDFKFDYAGQCALEWAAQSGQVRMVEILLANGARRTGQAMMKAAKYGHAETVRILIQSGVSLKLPDARYRTALHYAALNGDEKTVRVLLQSDANPRLKDEDGMTAVDLALAKGHAAVGKLLLAHAQGIKIHPSTLSMAAGNGHVACVKILLDLNAPSYGSESEIGAKLPQPWMLESCSGALGNGRAPALHEAAAAYQPSIVSLLLQSGIEPNALAPGQMTPLHYAAISYPPRGDEIARLLVNAGACVDSQTIMGMTPLHFAVQRGNSKLFRYLVSNGAKVGEVDSFGRSALQFAVTNGRNSLVQALLDLGCDPAAKDKSGFTMLDAARLNDDDSYMELRRILMAAVENPESLQQRPAKDPEKPTHWFIAVERGRLVPAGSMAHRDSHQPDVDVDSLPYPLHQRFSKHISDPDNTQ